MDRCSECDNWMSEDDTECQWCEDERALERIAESDRRIARQPFEVRVRRDGRWTCSGGWTDQHDLAVLYPLDEALESAARLDAEVVVEYR